MNETVGSLTVVAYRNKGTYGNVSLVINPHNLEAQLGLDYNINDTVQNTHKRVFYYFCYKFSCVVT